MATLLISLFGCFQKKEKKNDLTTWLETNFPGQLTVESNVVDLNPISLFDNKKSSIVADIQDPAVQIIVTWYKQPGLGITIDEIKTSLEDSRRDVKAARALFSALRARGLGHISVSVIDMAAYILIYEEPTAEKRKDYLGKILATMDSMPDHTQTSIWTEFMEPAIFQADFKDIIPRGYWSRGGTYHDQHKIMSHDFEWTPGLEVDILNTGWLFNSMSDRTTAYRQEAYAAALTWAQKNLPGTFYLEADQMVGIETDSTDLMVVKFHFPYFSSKPDTEVPGFEESALGFVSVSYQTDLKKAINIIKTEEL